MGIGVRKQVQLVQIAVTINSNRRNIETEGLKFGVWAEVTNPSGSRDYQNGKTEFGRTKRFLIRFRFDKYPGVDWKIKYDNKEWTISTIDKIDEKRFYWTLTGTSKNDV